LESIFDSAAKRFEDDLPAQEKVIYQRVESPDQVVSSIKKHISRLNTRNESRLFKACKKIDRLSNALEPYFQIIGIFVSSHPDLAAIIWGALTLVFQLSSQFVLFFERLTDMLQEIYDCLPNYKAKVELIRERALISGWRESHKILMRSLSLVYIDILQFCHDSCHLFSNKHQGT
jgi:hypothetical protein